MIMTAQTQTITRHDLETAIIQRSLADEVFRRQLISDPDGTFARYFQAQKTSVPRMTIHQEEPGSWHIVLPAKPLSPVELSDADLVKVAGGATPMAPTLFLATLVVSGVVSGSAVSAPVTVVEGGW
jgi:hypothetical protein